MSEKLGAMGGNMGGAFDDGVFDGVKKITIGKDFECISYIKIEYEKDGKFETREHGTIRGGLKEFEVEYPNEYITSIGGSYGHESNYRTTLIKSLFFKTSYRRTSPIFGATTIRGKPAGSEFLLEGKTGGKLLGFHGRSGQALDAIGPHFFAVSSPLKPFSPKGGNGGSAWDDGAYDGVRKILVGRGGKFVSYVRFEYAKGEKMVPHAHGKRQDAPQEFVVDYPNEHITLVEGTIDGYLTSLKFKTSKGRTSPVFGNVVGNKFAFEEKDFKLVGFCGRSGDVIDALGAHFGPLPAPAPAPAPAPTPTPTPTPAPTPTPTPAPAPTPTPTPTPASTKMGPVGGIKGNTFDDGVFDGVKKITVGSDVYSITYIKIEYEKDGKVEIREHGTNRGELKEFSVDNYPNDYIVAVGGSYDHIFNYDTTLITSLYFTTSKGFTSQLFGETKGQDFSFKGENGGKLLGFHGRGGHAIDAIGAFFTGKLSEKLGPVGGIKGNAFDDGVFDGVKKVIVGKDVYSITYIKIEYANNGKFETREHGTDRGGLEEFSVDYPNEYIAAVGGTYDHIFNYDTTLVTSLYFTTSKGFTSQLFGETSGTVFFFKGENGGKILGFHGRGDYAIDAIGAHFETGSKTDGSETKPGEGNSKPDDGNGTNPAGDNGSKPNVPGKVGPIGGNKGDTFDDGVSDGVKKVTVGADEYSVTYIKIEYEKNGKFESREHGTIRGELKEFVVDYPKDEITVVGGSYDHIFTYDTTLITSLYFTTSKGFTSQLFGKMTETEFKLEDKNGGKLVGFHGRGGFAIDAIGAHFETGSSSGSREKIEPQGGKGGNQWDDGAEHDGVAKIYVAPGGRGIENIKFDYVKNGETKEGSLHGVKAKGFITTIVVSHPDEYLVSVEGWYDSSNIIYGLKFKTNKNISDNIGYDFDGDGTTFSLQVKDKKIVGFHGFADSHINSLGAYFAPISSS